MITSKIPYEFIAKHTCLNWAEVKFGLERQYITASVAIQIATNRLCEEKSASSDEVYLAGLSENDHIAEIIDRLASNETEDNKVIHEKWLYLILAWLYKIRDSIKDPLAFVEEIYSDFDYPETVAKFVRYMPMSGPDLGSKEKNEARLFDYWKNYLNETSAKFRSE
jgi:hypothetical protein